MNLLVSRTSLLTLLALAVACTTPNSDDVTPSQPAGGDKQPRVTITTIAGTDTQKGYADGKGTNARFEYPYQMTIDRNDNLYVIDQLKSYWGGSVIRKVDPAGNVTTFAQGLGSVTDICVDPRDGVTLYAIESGDARGFDNGIFRISASGQVTRLSGGPDPEGGFSWGYRDGPLAQAKFYQPESIAMDRDGNLYIGDALNYLIRKVNLDTRTVTTLAGKYQPEGGACGLVDGKGTAAQFCTLADLTVDEAGNLYVPDWNNHSVRKITPDGSVSTYIGLGSGYGKDCPLSRATVWYPFRVHYDANSRQLLFADESGEYLNLVTKDDYVYSLTQHTIQTDYADKTPGAQHSIDGVVMNKKGEALILDKNNHCIRKATIAWK